MDLDANATTRPLDAVIALVARVMRSGSANPSSAHWLGAAARSVLEQAQDGVASLLPGILPEAVIFGSGGTEANNAVLAPACRDAAGTTLITTAVEHPSVLRPAEAFARAGGTVVLLPVSSDGLADPDALGRAVRRAPGPILVSVHWANSETGVVQPMGALVGEARRVRPDVFVHSDAAQAVGRVPVDLPFTGVDAVTFSGHKLHGPQGIGATVLRDPDDGRVAPLLLGGGQERGLRSGTQNVAGAAGLGLAARLRADALRPGRPAARRDAGRLRNPTARPAAAGARQWRRRAARAEHEQHPLPGGRGHGACGAAGRKGSGLLRRLGVRLRQAGAVPRADRHGAVRGRGVLQPPVLLLGPEHDGRGGVRGAARRRHCQGNRVREIT